MDNKKFKLWNRLVAVLMLVISAVVYLCTIEPTASFWDCGEFIASSYKLEVGHPPGNPVFQLFARFFTMFTGPENVALAVNAFSAICSAFTIFFLYLTIVFLAKRLFKPSADGTYTLGTAIAIFGSGAVGALVYTFTDTFWFSAVEGEVYAMSSLITALVFWAMTKWYEQAEQPHSSRWIVLISFLMGLSIGIHLLNLLAIPALVFLFYYKKREYGHYSLLEYVKIFLISVVILAVILYGIIPYLPQCAAYVDLFFVNVLGLPFNSGAAVFMIVLLALCFWGIYRTMQKKKVLLNTILLCFTMIVIGFSMFSIVVIRSTSKTPTNEYQPDNPFTLIRYLGREQYGSNPLIYGQYFDADGEPKETEYWAPLGDNYVKVKGPIDIEYKSEDKMLFPRMWSPSSEHIKAYTEYMEDDGLNHSGTSENTYRKPTFGENLEFFFDYQMNWMYWRYFMWNFVGRQNDIHSPSPGDPLKGNWESGIGFFDEPRLGDQSDAPDYLKYNKGKNHYYMLPLLLGIIGIFFQFARDKRGNWVTFLMFFMTGIAIVLYLNQPPRQVRERDYAYAGSFYSFSIWIGLAVAALYSLILEFAKLTNRGKAIAASVVTVATLGVPTLMAVENWDDHDRSNRYTAVEMAKNYLNSVGKNGILITHGDNDTFPLWYAQEVEGIRPDVRIANTSLLGTDWHIDQMKWAMNESAPLKLSLGQESYIYGTNDFMYISPVSADTVFLATDLINHFKDLNNTLQQVEFELNLGPDQVYGPEVLPVRHKKNKDLRESVMASESFKKMVGGYKLSKSNIVIKKSKDLGMYVPTRKFVIPVNRENVIKSGILNEKYRDTIPDQIVLSIPEGKSYISKSELFMLDLLANYDWSRPISLLSKGGEINIGIKDYLMYDGFSYRFIPIKNSMGRDGVEFADPDDLYYKMKNVYTWDALKRKDYFVDYQNFYTFCGVLSQRNIFLNVAKILFKDKQPEKAVEILDMCMECVPEENFPLDVSYMGTYNEGAVLKIIDLYFKLGEHQKAEAIALRMMNYMRESQRFFSRFEEAQETADQLLWYINYLVEIYQQQIDKMDFKAETDKITNYLNLCSVGLNMDYSNCEGWEKQIQYYIDLGLEDKASNAANLVLPQWIDSTTMMLKGMQGLVAAGEKAYKDLKNAYDAYQREEEKPRPSKQRLNTLKDNIMECEARCQEYNNQIEESQSLIEYNEAYIQKLLYQLQEAGFDSVVDKIIRQFKELQETMENLWSEE